MSRFSVGDKVRKVVGYPFVGTVAAVYENEEKCSVRHADGWDHIFHDKQLTLDHPEYQYLELLRDCLENGIYREGRNGGTYGLFGRQIRFDLTEGFPLLTTKKMFTKGIIGELIWFLSGSTNVKYLRDNGIHIWDSWRRPYSMNRRIIEVDPIINTFEGYSGNFHSDFIPTNMIDENLLRVWEGMMRRCYDPKYHNYEHYGKKAVSVSRDWHSATKFIEDAKRLPHWEYKANDLDGFHLDKDYFSSNQYSSSTCVWLSKEENRIYRSSIYPIIVTKPDGWSKVYLTAAEVSRIYGIPTSTLHLFIKEDTLTVKGNNERFRGWVFSEYITDKPLRLEVIKTGDLGSVYGKQWRNFNGIDQIQNVIDGLKNDPHGRRHIVSAWNVAEIDEMALPPCHCLFQFFVDGDDLSCQLYQRSADVFLGVPFNISSYALLTYMIAAEVGFKPKEFIHTFGDVHLYANHVEQAREQLSRTPYPFPQLNFDKSKGIFNLQIEDFELFDYKCHPTIKAEVSR